MRIGPHPAAGVALVHPFRGTLATVEPDGTLYLPKLYELVDGDPPAHFELQGRRLHVRRWGRGSIILWAGSRVVEGRLTDAEGRGLAYVGLGIGFGDALDIPATHTDHEGRFRIESITPSRQPITILGDGWLRWGSITTIPESESATAVTLKAARAVAVNVRLHTPPGTHGAGIQVNASFRSPFRPGEHHDRIDARARADGTATLWVPPAGTVWFNAGLDNASGFVALRSNHRPKEIPLTLHHRDDPPRAWIPIADPRAAYHSRHDVALHVWPLERPWERPRKISAHTARAPDGTTVWDCEGLQPGRYRVQISAKGWKRACVDAEATAAGEWPPAQVTADPARPAVLKVRVVDASGAPLEGAAIEVQLPDEDDPFAPFAGIGQWHGYKRSNRDLPIPAGSYRVRAGPSRDASVRSDWVRAEAPGERVTLVARPLPEKR